jgi:hypothetical protein
MLVCCLPTAAKKCQPVSCVPWKPSCTQPHLQVFLATYCGTLVAVKLIEQVAGSGGWALRV